MSILFYKKISIHDFKDDFIHLEREKPSTWDKVGGFSRSYTERPAEWHLIQPFLDGVHALANHSRPVFQQT